MRSAGRTATARAVAIGTALLAFSHAAAAQDVAAAEALFHQGRALLEKGDLPAACAKLAESQRLDPSSGTALNLALCHEKEGKTATAWAEYKLAARLSRQQQKPERAEEATRHADALEKQLSYLTIEAASPVPGLEVKRDDVLLEEGSLGARLPVDPGKHVVKATAPGYAPVTLEVTLGTAGDAQRVTIPALDKTPIAPPTSGPAGSGEPATPPPSHGRGPAPWVVGGLGVASLGVGIAFGALALKSYGDAKAACPTMRGCSSSALDLRSTASTQANLANVTIPVGAAGIVVSTILFLVLPKGDTAAPAKAASFGRSVAIVPAVGPGNAGLTLAGAFR